MCERQAYIYIKRQEPARPERPTANSKEMYLLLLTLKPRRGKWGLDDLSLH